MFGRLGQALAHPGVVIGDRDDPADGLDVAIVGLGRDFAGSLEVAQEGADEAVAVSNRKDRVRGDARCHHQVRSGLDADGVHEGLLERPTVLRGGKPPPEVERVGAPRLDQLFHRFREVAGSHHAKTVVGYPDHEPDLGLEGGDHPLQQNPRDDLLGDVRLGQEGQAHQGFELGRESPFLIEASLQALHEPPVLDGAGDLRGSLEDRLVGRARPAGTT